MNVTSNITPYYNDRYNNTLTFFRKKLLTTAVKNQPRNYSNFNKINVDNPGLNAKKLFRNHTKDYLNTTSNLPQNPRYKSTKNTLRKKASEKHSSNFTKENSYVLDLSVNNSPNINLRTNNINFNVRNLNMSFENCDKNKENLGCYYVRTVKNSPRKMYLNGELKVNDMGLMVEKGKSDSNFRVNNSNCNCTKS